MHMGILHSCTSLAMSILFFLAQMVACSFLLILSSLTFSGFPLLNFFPSFTGSMHTLSPTPMRSSGFGGPWTLIEHRFAFLLTLIRRDFHSRRGDPT